MRPPPRDPPHSDPPPPSSTSCSSSPLLLTPSRSADASVARSVSRRGLGPLTPEHGGGGGGGGPGSLFPSFLRSSSAGASATVPRPDPVSRLWRTRPWLVSAPRPPAGSTTAPAPSPGAPCLRQRPKGTGAAYPLSAPRRRTPDFPRRRRWRYRRPRSAADVDEDRVTPLLGGGGGGGRRLTERWGGGRSSGPGTAVGRPRAPNGLDVAKGSVEARWGREGEGGRMGRGKEKFALWALGRRRREEVTEPFF